MPSPKVVRRDVLDIEYSVRGPIPLLAAELEKQGKQIIRCNIGNPQALGQRPITYYRGVLSLVEDPARIRRERTLSRLFRDDPAAAGLADVEFVSDDVLDVAETILSGLTTRIGGRDFVKGTGAYTESKGPLFIREAVARYIDRRDGLPDAGGVPADPERIFLTNGASEGARNLIEMLIADRHDGIMIPIPQYPLYSATITRCGGVQVNYYPDEDKGWTFDRATLEEPLREAEKKGARVKAIVVINPANPTGAILDEPTIKAVIEFAKAHELAIIADEVYQQNTYGAEFVSFAKALGKNDVLLFSLHSTSKGFYGECGHRGGYFEVRNPAAVAGSDADVCGVLYKMASVNLCSNTVGQVLTYLLARPPEEGAESHAQFVAERDAVLDDLYAKAMMIKEAFKEMAGVECFGRFGAMYLFPRLHLPDGKTDFDYCVDLLKETGLCTVNGSGFGQKDGTQHLRIAVLPPKELLGDVLPRWIEFHNAYVGRS